MKSRTHLIASVLGVVMFIAIFPTAAYTSNRNDKVKVDPNLLASNFLIPGSFGISHLFRFANRDVLMLVITVGTLFLVYGCFPDGAPSVVSFAVAFAVYVAGACLIGILHYPYYADMCTTAERIDFAAHGKLANGKICAPIPKEKRTETLHTRITLFGLLVPLLIFLVLATFWNPPGIASIATILIFAMIVWKACAMYSPYFDGPASDLPGLTADWLFDASEIIIMLAIACASPAIAHGYQPKT